MPPLTLLNVAPDAHLQFPTQAPAASMRLSNISGGLVAYKVKSTAPKNYVIRPSAGSIRRGEIAEVTIIRKGEEGAPEAAPPGPDKKPDRFLIQAAAVDTDEKKMLLHAAHRGKSAGAAKFWDGVPKDFLEEKQLVAQFVEGDSAATADAEAMMRTDTEAPMTRKNSKGTNRPQPAAGMMMANPNPGVGMPSTEDVDAIIGKISLPGRSQMAPKLDPSMFARTGGPPGLNDGFDASLPPEEYLPPAQPQIVAGGSSEVAAPRKPPVARRKDDIVLQKHSRPVTFVAFDPAFKVLYTCGKDKVVLAWSCPEGECLRWYEGHRGAVWACSVSVDNQLLLSCGADSMVLLWDVASAQQLAEVQLPGVVRCVEWNPSPELVRSGRRIFASCSNSFKNHPASVVVMEFTQGSEQGTAESHQLFSIEEPDLPSGATQVAWAGTQADRLVSIHPNGEVLFWSAGSGLSMGRLQAHEGATSQVAFSQLDRGLMATCGRTDMMVKLWDVGTATEVATLIQSLQSDRPLNAVALRPSLSREDFAQADTGEMQVYDCLIGGGQDAREVALVGAGTDDQFDPVSLRRGDGEELHSCLARSDRSGGHFGPIHALAFSLDGTLCVSGSEDGNVRIRDLSEPDGVVNAAPPVVAQPARAAAPPPSQQKAAAPSRQAAQPKPKPAEAAPPEGFNSSGTRMVAAFNFDPSMINWPSGANAQPLPLQRGQEIEVIQDVSDGWALGRAVGHSEAVGLFPTNYALPMHRYQEMLQQAQVSAPDAARQQQVESRGVPAAMMTGGLHSVELTTANGNEEDEEEGDCSQS